MSDTDVRLPRVTIQFCTQCKWNLRAAYFAQELLQTFSTSLGEVALLPSTGGVFKVDIYHSPSPSVPQSATSPTPASASSEITSQQGRVDDVQHRTLWDRSTDGGFPETKELKRRVRDVIEPGRNLGHVDREYPRQKQEQQQQQRQQEHDTADKNKPGGSGVSGARTALPAERKDEAHGEEQPGRRCEDCA